MLSSFLKPSPNTFSAPNVKHFLSVNLLLFTVYALAEIVLFRMVLNLEIYQGWAAWFLPAGMTLSALMLSPFRYWPVTLVAPEVGYYLHHLIYFQSSFGWHEVSTSVTSHFRLGPLTAIFAVAVIKSLSRSQSITRFQPLVWALLAAVVYRFPRTLTLVLSPAEGSLLYQGIPEARKFELVLTHFLGGMTGILIVLPVMYFLFEAWQQRKTIHWSKVAVGLNQLLVIATGFFVIYFLQPHTYYLLRMLAIIPLIWFAYQFGWYGAVSALIVINGFIIAKVYGVNQADVMIENQLYVISYSLTALCIGALIHEQRLVSKKLEQQNLELTQSNATLKELSQTNQRLASKAVESQEQDRKALSQELHDDVGQSITALKAELKVMERSMKNTGANFDRLNYVADQIYDSVYSVLNWLRPRVLDDLGLEACLKGRYLSSRLVAANIEYYCSITGEVNQIPERLQITILRICQEAVTNCIKHSNAATLSINLNVSNTISLSIKDDGQTISSPQHNGGFGLQTIEERVLSHGGAFSFHTQQGFSIVINIPNSKHFS